MTIKELFKIKLLLKNAMFYHKNSFESLTNEMVLKYGDNWKDKMNNYELEDYNLHKEQFIDIENLYYKFSNKDWK